MAALPASHPAALLTNRMTPAEQLAHLLSGPKRSGVPFDRAWTYALDWVRWPHDKEHRAEWKEAVAWAKPVWQAAYENVKNDPVAAQVVGMEPVAA